MSDLQSQSSSGWPPLLAAAVLWSAMLAAVLCGVSQAAAAPRGSEQWLICEMGGPTIDDTEENGCCTDEDQDGFIDTCWVCDEEGENCLEEELGEDLRAQRPGAGSIGGTWSTGPSGPSTAVPSPGVQFRTY